MNLLLDGLWLAAGIALLLAGGDRTVRGASGVAQGLGVPPIAIGLTVVAFGTSAPELVVNLLAAIRGSSAIAFGNVVGSNIANIGLILGLSVLLRPLAVSAQLISREIPMMILATVALLVMGSDRQLTGDASAIDRPDGIVLLLLFGVFMYYTIAGVLAPRHTDEFVTAAVEVGAPATSGSTPLSALWLLLGLGGLALGGHLTVEGATGLARGLGVPEVIVGVTLVAVGTSLPELVTSLIAARRGQSDLALGNVVGSNIFNALFIMGLGTTIAEVDVPAGGGVDLLVALGFALVLLPLAATGRRRLTRVEGAALLVGYLGYVGWRVGAGALGA